MNPHVIRERLSTHKGERVRIKINGMRNRVDHYTGIIKEIYPQIFTVDTSSGIKSFSYSEIINGEVIISFI